jgi:hypothetical protein
MLLISKTARILANHNRKAGSAALPPRVHTGPVRHPAGGEREWAGERRAAGYFRRYVAPGGCGRWGRCRIIRDSNSFPNNNGNFRHRNLVRLLSGEAKFP